MNPSSQSLIELKEILENDYQRSFSVDEVKSIATWLLGYYGRLAKSDYGLKTTEVNDDIIK